MNKTDAHRPGPAAGILILAAALLFILGCEGKAPAPDEDAGGPVLALVGGEELRLADVEEAFAESAGLYGASGGVGHGLREKVELVATDRALTLLAERTGTEKRPDSTGAPAHAERHALAMRMVELKKAELLSGVTVSEPEIDEFALRARYNLKYVQNVYYEGGPAEEFMDRVLAGRPLPWQDERIVSGPDGVSPALAAELYSMMEGQVSLFRRGRRHVVIMLLEKTGPAPVRALPPRDHLRRRLLELKRADALDEWITRVMEEAPVVVNEQAVKDEARR